MPSVIGAVTLARLNVTCIVTVVSTSPAFFTFPKLNLYTVPSLTATVLLGGKYATVPVSTISTLAASVPI